MATDSWRDHAQRIEMVLGPTGGDCHLLINGEDVTYRTKGWTVEVAAGEITRMTIEWALMSEDSQARGRVFEDGITHVAAPDVRCGQRIDALPTDRLHDDPRNFCFLPYPHPERDHRQPGEVWTDAPRQYLPPGERLVQHIA